MARQSCGGTAGTGSAHDMSALCPGRGPGGTPGGLSPAVLGRDGAALGDSGHSTALRGLVRAGVPLPSRGMRSQPGPQPRLAGGEGERGRDGGWGRLVGFRERRSAPRRLREGGVLWQAPRDEQSRRIKEPCVCVRGRCAAAPARSAPPPLPPLPGARCDRAPLGAGAQRGTDTSVCVCVCPLRLHSPALLRRPKSGRGHPCGAEPGFGRPGVGVSPPGRGVKLPGTGTQHRVLLGCSDTDGTATRCIVSSGVSRFPSYAFACGRWWWWGLFLFLCSGWRDPPLFPAGNL